MTDVRGNTNPQIVETTVVQTRVLRGDNRWVIDRKRLLVFLIIVIFVILIMNALISLV